MKILLVSPNGDTACDLSLSMMRDGNEVRVFMPVTKKNDSVAREVGDDLIRKVLSLKGQPEWADLIVVDALGEPVGFDTGKFVDEQRKAGKRVVGAGTQGEKLEQDRHFGIEVMKKAGVRVIPSQQFDTFEDGYKFISANPAKYVFKPNITSNSEWTYVGKDKDGKDVMEEMRKIEPQWPKDQPVDFEIQVKVSGVEVDVGGYFSASLGDFLNPIWVQFEHKKFAAGDEHNPRGMGFNIGEAGSTHVWAGKRQNKFMAETFDKLLPFLKGIGFCGPIDLNCIVNEEGVWPLEFTVRFPIPETFLNGEMQKTEWAALLHAMTGKGSAGFAVEPGYGIVVQMFAEGFPFEEMVDSHSRGKKLPVFPASTVAHVHPEWLKANANEDLVIAARVGIPFCVTARGATMEEARKLVYQRIGPLANSYLWYRPDIGTNTMRDLKELKQLGYDFDVPVV